MEFRLGRWHVSLTLVFILLGFLLATAFSTQQRLEDRPGTRKDNLIQFIRKQRREQKRLGAQLTEVREELGYIDAERADSEGVLAAHSQELERLRSRAGLVPVTGPGLELTVGDAQRIPPDVNPDSFLIHDYDLQMIVNALWRGGAEALAVNGERFVASTGIRSAGSIILINSRPQPGPYRVRAIGDAEGLVLALKQDNYAAMLLGESAAQFGLQIDTRPQEKMTLPGYTGGVKLSTKEES